MSHALTEISGLWAEASKILRHKICATTFEQWFANIVPVRLDNDRIILGVSDDFFADWLRNNYEDILASAIQEAGGKAYTIDFESGHIAKAPAVNCVMPVKEEPRATPRYTETVQTPVPAQKRIHNGINPRHTFENFVVGEENRYAHAAAMTAAGTPGAYNPLYIYGGTGLGKTHLLQAVANETLNRNPNAQIEYVTCEEFLNCYVDSLQQRKHSEFRNRFRTADVLLVDDVHQLANKAQLQEEFFNTFNTLFHKNSQIILTSDKQPSEIAGLEKRLVTRFESGVAVEITAPSFETRLAILKMKQESHLVKFGDDILNFIASNVRSSIRILEGALIRLVAYSSVTRDRAVTLKTAEQLLKKLFEQENMTRKITVETIQKRVAEHFSIHVHDIIGKKRPKNIAEPRMIAMYLTRKMTDKSFPEIGLEFGGRNHATVIHAVKEIEDSMNTDPAFKQTVSALQRQIQAIS